MAFSLSIPDEMRQKYIDRRTADLSQLRAALEKSEYEAFHKIGHQLKGNAATFGYDSLGLLGERMEKAGEARDRAEAESCLTELQGWLESQKKA